jgi:hypothetical protein
MFIKEVRCSFSFKKETNTVLRVDVYPWEFKTSVQNRTNSPRHASRGTNTTTLWRHRTRNHLCFVPRKIREARPLPTLSFQRSPSTDRSPSGKPRYYPRPSCPLPRGATASSQQGGRQLIPRDRSKKGVTCRPATGARDVELEVGGISFSFSHPRRVRNLIGGAPTV